jgi:hypothetical protein
MKCAVGRWCLFVGKSVEFIGAFVSEEAAYCAGKTYSLPQVVFLSGDAEIPLDKEVDIRKKIQGLFIAPAIIQLGGDDDAKFRLSSSLHESREEAQRYWGVKFISWPAIANEDGMYEVPR